MKRFIFLFAIIFAVSIATAQQNTFSKVLFDTVNANAIVNEYFINNAIEAFDAGYILAGWNLSWKDYNYSQIGLLTLKTDEEGSPEWNRVITAKGNTAYYQQYGLYRTIPTFDSCYMSVGFMTDSLNKRYGVCLKFNNEGDTIWTKVITGDESIFLYDVSQTIDSGFIISGSVGKPSNTYKRIYLFVAKLNKYGDILWSKKYSNGTEGNRGYSIKPVDDTNYMVSGVVWMDNFFNDSSFIAKISKQGMVIWAKKYYRNEYNNGIFIQDFIVKENGIVFNSITREALLLSGTDSTGAIIWSKKYPCYQGFWIENYLGFKLHETEDNGYVLLGGDKEKGDLVVTDSLGDELFHTQLLLNPVNVMSTKDNGYFIAGLGPIWTSKKSWLFSSEIGFIKLDSLGESNDRYFCSYLLNYLPSVDDTIFSEDMSFSEEPYGKTEHLNFSISSVNILERDGCVDYIGAIPENHQKSIQLFPNPTTGTFTILVDAGETGDFMVYNTLGQMVLKQKITTENSTINLTSQYAGVYFYRFVFKDKKVATGKLIISK